jgi:molecular chaperone DnaK
VRNSASSLIYSTEKSLKEVGDKLDPQARGDVETALSELKRVSENGTVEEVKPAVDRLQQASYKMAELLYKATAPEGDAAGAGAGAADGANAGQNGSTSAGPPPDDVIDAEFKESQ